MGMMIGCAYFLGVVRRRMRGRDRRMIARVALWHIERKREGGTSGRYG